MTSVKRLPTYSPAPTAGRRMPNRPSILIVDDMPSNIKILGEGLRPYYEIVVATSGEQALELASEIVPDLILLDIMMPGMDGYTVCRQLKADARTKNTPVIFITAKTQAEDEVFGFELGAADYITKPFRLPVVQVRVKTQLDLKRKYDLLESMAALDGLTEIPNRRRFDDALAHEWRRTLRTGQPLTVIMMDIDFFKNFNDHYGHMAGDECLRLVALALRQAVNRPGDLVARFGGEEFVALLPDTGAKAALHLAEAMRLEVSGLRIPHAHSPAADHVTLSLGAATRIPDKSLSPASLVDEADKLLYQAKQGGRNRSKARVIGPPPGSSPAKKIPADPQVLEDSAEKRDEASSAPSSA